MLRPKDSIPFLRQTSVDITARRLFTEGDSLRPAEQLLVTPLEPNRTHSFIKTKFAKSEPFPSIMTHPLLTGRFSSDLPRMPPSYQKGRGYMRGVYIHLSRSLCDGSSGNVRCPQHTPPVRAFRKHKGS